MKQKETLTCLFFCCDFVDCFCGKIEIIKIENVYVGGMYVFR